jgi:outer membrane lipoprotein-sorting protein
MKIMHYMTLPILFTIAIANAAAADKTTNITEANGDRTTVHTDSKGTQTTTEGKVIYSSGGDQHQSQVERSTKQGGTIDSGPAK